MENVSLNDWPNVTRKTTARQFPMQSQKAIASSATHSLLQTVPTKKVTPLVTRRVARFVIGPWQSRPEFSRPLLRAQCPRSPYRSPLSIRQKRRGPHFPRFLPRFSDDLQTFFFSPPTLHAATWLSLSVHPSKCLILGIQSSKPLLVHDNHAGSWV